MSWSLPNWRQKRSRSLHSGANHRRTAATGRPSLNVLCANHRQTAGSSSHSAAPLAPTTAKLQSKAQPEPDRRREPPPNSSHQRRSTPRHRPTQPQRSRANHRRTAGCDSHSATLLAPAATEQQPDAQPEPNQQREPPPNSSHQRRSHRPTQPQRSAAEPRRNAATSPPSPEPRGANHRQTAAAYNRGRREQAPQPHTDQQQQGAAEPAAYAAWAGPPSPNVSQRPPKVNDPG